MRKATLAVVGIWLAIYAFGVAQLRAEEQTRFYDARGNSIGTASPQSNGSVRYYDARGNSLGTSTTTGGVTRFYDAGGKPTGSFQFDGRMWRPGTGR
jgi:YD repeat-containing protein